MCEFDFFAFFKRENLHISSHHGHASVLASNAKPWKFDVNTRDNISACNHNCGKCFYAQERLCKWLPDVRIWFLLTFRTSKFTYFFIPWSCEGTGVKYKSLEIWCKYARQYFGMCSWLWKTGFCKRRVIKKATWCVNLASSSFYNVRIYVFCHITFNWSFDVR